MSWYIQYQMGIQAKKYKEYIEGGMSESEAWQKATDDAKAAFSGKAETQYADVVRPRLLEDNSVGMKPDDMLAFAGVYMMVKQPAMLERLVKSYMDNQAKIISHLAQAGAGNLVTAYSHSFLIALMLEQNYIIRQHGSDDLIQSLNVLVGATALTNLLQGFAVPEVLTYAATGFPISPGKMTPALARKTASK